jgi:MHS family proline/betaine transporter-like MFS transporter
LTLVLSKPDLAAWGWRIPFAFGLLIAPIGYLLRRALPDHPSGARHAAPAREAVRHHWRTILLAIPIVMGSTVTTYVMIYFMPSFLVRIAGLPSSTGFASSTVSSIIILILAPLCGWWLKPGTPRRMVVVLSYAGAAVSILPVFWLLTHHASLPVVVAAIAWITLLMTVGSTASLIFIIEHFPAHVRATAFGLVYALGVTVFGGTAQFVVTWLVIRTGSPMAAGGYVMLCQALGVGGALLLREFPIKGGPARSVLTMRA